MNSETEVPRRTHFSNLRRIKEKIAKISLQKFQEIRKILKYLSVVSYNNIIFNKDFFFIKVACILRLYDYPLIPAFLEISDFQIIYFKKKYTNRELHFLQ